MTSWPNDSGFDTCYEEHEPVALAVKGKIPTYAAGVLYRTGPLGYKVETDQKKTWAANHWFDGFSAVHRFQIDFPEGSTTPEVTYRSRRLADEYLELARKTGKIDSITFASKRDPCETFFKKVMSMFYAKRDTKNVGVTLSINMPGGGYVKGAEKPTVNGHTNSITHGIETLHTKTDANTMRKIDPVTLEPQRMWNQTKLHPALKGPFTAAHSKSDPETHDLFNFNLDFAYKSTYRVFRTSASTGETDILATFPGKPAYLHSLFLSENYVILCVWNSHITWGGLSVLFNKNVVDAIAPFDPSSKAKWYVVDRKHGKGLVATYESEPFFSFHSINAWEEPSSSDPKKIDIVCELTHYDNTDVIHRFFYDNIISSNNDNTAYAGKKRMSCLPNIAQFRLGSVNAVTTPTTPLPAELNFKADKFKSLELAVINPAYVTQRHRFVWGCCDRLKSSFMDSLGKFDNTTQETIFWETEGHTPGEPIFVADPEGKAEDDGVLLSVVLDGFKEQSYMLVLDARNMQEIGRAEMKGPMAFGFHGTFKTAEVGYRGDY